LSSGQMTKVINSKFWLSLRKCPVAQSSPGGLQ
jgi:hypothetical protein